jgi:hypothetical protein
VVKSVSVVVVDGERLVDDSGCAGAEKVLDTVDCTESCESCGSGLVSVAMGAVCVVVVGASEGAIHG